MYTNKPTNDVGWEIVILNPATKRKFLNNWRVIIIILNCLTYLSANYTIMKTVVGGLAGLVLLGVGVSSQFLTDKTLRCPFTITFVAGFMTGVVLDAAIPRNLGRCSTFLRVHNWLDVLYHLHQTSIPTGAGNGMPLPEDAFLNSI